MKFLVPNYSCLQNSWLGGYRSQIPVLSVLCPQLNLLNPPPKKIPGYATALNRVNKMLNYGDRTYRREVTHFFSDLSVGIPSVAF